MSPTPEQLSNVKQLMPIKKKNATLRIPLMMCVGRGHTDNRGWGVAPPLGV